MSTLSFTTYTMPSANLNQPNPLPDLSVKADAHASIPIDEQNVTAEEARYMGWGRVPGILPYLIQDGYDRKRKDRDWKAAVLENGHLSATFLPELGGRLWSLIDKDTGRELLHRNPVFQPCNLALRNAWISGGVEWNIGMIGHTPFTVDRLFAEKLALDDGTPVLRMYEYERIRRLVYRIEAMLPEDSHQLFVRVRIDNTSDEDTAVYWWSNIAVDEREDVRVLVPAERAFRFGYGGKLSKVPVPYMTLDRSKLSGSTAAEGETLDIDISRTMQIPQAMDFFFDIPKGHRRWIAAVGGDGYGFAQSSTDALIGRKLFVWGMGAGGRNWQRFLSTKDSAYIEIQAGLAHTQLEHLPMKAGETIDWVESYGPVRVNAQAAQGQNWPGATQALENALEDACPRASLEALLATARAQLDGRPGEPLMAGSGWAYVQGKRLGDGFHARGLSFPASSVGEAEAAWLALAETGALPCPDPLEAPTGYQIGAEWIELLAQSIQEGGSAHWFGYYQYGVALARAGQAAEAEAALKSSLACAQNPWALCALAALRRREERLDEAADLYVQAVGLLPARAIAREALDALHAAGRSREVIDVYARLPEDVRGHHRIRTAYVRALVDVGEAERAIEMLSQPFDLTDVREGEVLLTDLWFRAQALRLTPGEAPGEEAIARARRECPPPAHLDFRMQ